METRSRSSACIAPTPGSWFERCCRPPKSWQSSMRLRARSSQRPSEFMPMVSSSRPSPIGGSRSGIDCARGTAACNTSSTTSIVFLRYSANSICICWPRETTSPVIANSALIRSSIEGVEGVAFAVWAPNARRLSVVGDFNAWDGRRMPMRRRQGIGFWELFVPGLRPGRLYKYEIVGAGRGVAAAEGRPAGRAIRTAAGHCVDRRRAVAARLAGRSLDGAALAEPRSRLADRGL